MQFFTTPLSRNSQRTLGHKENQTKYRKMTMKPRSHVRISILFIYSQALGFHGNESFRYRVVTVVLK